MCADDRALSEVFKLFDLIHILTADHKTVSRITKEVCGCNLGVVVNLLSLHLHISNSYLQFIFHAR